VSWRRAAVLGGAVAAAFAGAMSCVGDTGSAAHPDWNGGGVVAQPVPEAGAQPDAGAIACLTNSQQTPSEGGACRPEGLVCEYGSSPLLGCDSLASCTNGEWRAASGDSGSCLPAAVDGCPPSVSDVPIGSACAPVNLDCDYPAGRCECAQNLPLAGWPGSWKCSMPVEPTDSGSLVCPGARPRLGTPCSQEGAECRYGACEIRGGALQACEGGVWIAMRSACSCPANVPQAGASCTRPGLECEYGTSPIVSCNPRARCNGSEWSLTAPDPDAPCAGAEPVEAGPGCDDVRPRLGAPCMTQGFECNYGACEIPGGTLLKCLDVWTASPEACGPGSSDGGPDAEAEGAP
jgi:hypothetical protein